MDIQIPRLTPLALCLAAGLSLSQTVHAGDARVDAIAATSAALHPHPRLQHDAVTAHHALTSVLAQTSGAIIAVTNCNNSGAGSLRDAVAQADTFSNDVTVDMSGLQCSSISLTTGAITTNNTHTGNLFINGPGKRLVVIGGNSDRVINHLGNGLLTIYNLSIGSGHITAADAKGGCIYSANNVSLHGVDVSYCSIIGTQSAYGGGIYAKSTAALLDQSTARHNVAYTSTGRASGGAMFAPRVDVKYSRVSHNDALVVTGVHNSASGGGIAAKSFSGSNCTFDDNAATNSGGAIYAGPLGGPNSLLSCTISGNTANNGAGVYSKYTMTVENSTIALNTASCSGASCAAGLAILAGNLTLNSTIIADNQASGTANDFCVRNTTGNSVTGSHDLVMTFASGLSPPAGTLTSDPKLQPLAWNGGFTPTHDLGSGSAAINHGSAGSGVIYDQRGSAYPRTRGTSPDIGAFEAFPDVIFRSNFDLLSF